MRANTCVSERVYVCAHTCSQHLLKDVKLFKREAEAMDLNTELLSALQSVIQDTCDRGLDNTDYSAVHDAITHPTAQQLKA